MLVLYSLSTPRVTCQGGGGGMVPGLVKESDSWTKLTFHSLQVLTWGKRRRDIDGVIPPCGRFITEGINPQIPWGCSPFVEVLGLTGVTDKMLQPMGFVFVPPTVITSGV